MTIQRQSSTEVGTEQRRLRLRDWLEMRIDDPKYPGLCWEDKEKRMFRIPWKHGARHGWREKEDARLFREWSQHTGATPRDVKQHKANFRCALNSLRDVEKVNSCTKNKGDDAYRLYRMLPKKSTKSTSRWIRKRGQRNINCAKGGAAASQNQHKTLPSAYTQQTNLQPGFCATLTEQGFTPYASSSSSAHFAATSSYPRPFVYPAGDFRSSAYGQLYSNQQQPQQQQHAVNQTQCEAYFNPYLSPEFAATSPLSLTPSDSASGCFFSDLSPNVSPLGVQGPLGPSDPEFTFTQTGVSDAIGQAAAIQRDDGEAPFSSSPSYSWDSTQGVHSPSTPAMSFEQSSETTNASNEAPNQVPLSPQIAPNSVTPKTPSNPNFFTPDYTFGTSPIATDLSFKSTPNYPVFEGVSAPNLIHTPHPTYVAPAPLPTSPQPQYGNNSVNCNVQISHDFSHRSSINVAITATNCCAPSRQQAFETDSTTTKGISPDFMTSQPSGNWTTKSKSDHRGCFADLSPNYGRCTSESYTEGSGFDSCGESEAKCEAFSESADSVFMDDWPCDPPLTALYSGSSSHRMSGSEFTRLPSANTLLSSSADDYRVTSWLESTKYESHFSSLNPSEVYGK